MPAHRRSLWQPVDLDAGKKLAGFVIGTATIFRVAAEVLRKGVLTKSFCGFTQVQNGAKFLPFTWPGGRDPLNFDLNELAVVSEGFSGLKSSRSLLMVLYDAFEDSRELTDRFIQEFETHNSAVTNDGKQNYGAAAVGPEHARPASEPPQPQPLYPSRGMACVKWNWGEGF